MDKTRRKVKRVPERIKPAVKRFYLKRFYFLSRGSIFNCIGERSEYFFGHALFHSFGVKLSAENIFAVNRRFDREVGGDGDDFRVVRNDIHGLTMRGIHPVEFTEYFSACGNGVVNVLFAHMPVHVFQRSAEERVDELKTPAYRENGLVFTDKAVQKIKFEFVFDEIYVAGGNVAAIKRRQNVAAADEQKSAVSVNASRG